MALSFVNPLRKGRPPAALLVWAVPLWFCAALIALTLLALLSPLRSRSWLRRPASEQ
jgi:hypothetical protein